MLLMIFYSAFSLRDLSSALLVSGDDGIAHAAAAAHGCIGSHCRRARPRRDIGVRLPIVAKARLFAGISVCFAEIYGAIPRDVSIPIRLNQLAHAVADFLKVRLALRKLRQLLMRFLHSLLILHLLSNRIAAIVLRILLILLRKRLREQRDHER